jgi:hypothetical protein
MQKPQERAEYKELAAEGNVEGIFANPGYLRKSRKGARY